MRYLREDDRNLVAGGITLWWVVTVDNNESGRVAGGQELLRDRTIGWFG